jgi:hypothetical protein
MTRPISFLTGAGAAAAGWLVVVTLGVLDWPQAAKASPIAVALKTRRSVMVMCLLLLLNKTNEKSPAILAACGGFWRAVEARVPMVACI